MGGGVLKYTEKFEEIWPGLMPGVVSVPDGVNPGDGSRKPKQPSPKEIPKPPKDQKPKTETKDEPKKEEDAPPLKTFGAPLEDKPPLKTFVRVVAG